MSRDVQHAFAIVVAHASDSARRLRVAQDRMPPIPAERLTDAQKKAMEEFTAAQKG